MEDAVVFFVTAVYRQGMDSPVVGGVGAKTMKNEDNNAGSG